jgi:hypothetical protein
MQEMGIQVSLGRRYDLFSLSCVEEAGLKSRLFCCTGASLPGIHRGILGQTSLPQAGL